MPGCMEMAMLEWTVPVAGCFLGLIFSVVGLSVNWMEKTITAGSFSTTLEWALFEDLPNGFDGSSSEPDWVEAVRAFAILVFLCAFVASGSTILAWFTSPIFPRSNDEYPVTTSANLQKLACGCMFGGSFCAMVAFGHFEDEADPTGKNLDHGPGFSITVFNFLFFATVGAGLLFFVKKRNDSLSPNASSLATDLPSAGQLDKERQGQEEAAKKEAAAKAEAEAEAAAKAEAEAEAAAKAEAEAEAAAKAEAEAEAAAKAEAEAAAKAEAEAAAKAEAEAAAKAEAEAAAAAKAEAEAAAKAEAEAAEAARKKAEEEAAKQPKEMVKQLFLSLASEGHDSLTRMQFKKFMQETGMEHDMIEMNKMFADKEVDWDEYLEHINEEPYKSDGMPEAFEKACNEYAAKQSGAEPGPEPEPNNGE